MALLAVLAVASAADAAIVTVSSATVDVGDTFTIAVSIDAAADLSALQFDLGFGPSFVQADGSGASLGPLLPADWFLASPGAVDNTLGVVLGVAAFGSPSQGGGALAQVRRQGAGRQRDDDGVVAGQHDVDDDDGQQRGEKLSWVHGNRRW